MIKAMRSKTKWKKLDAEYVGDPDSSVNEDKTGQHIIIFFT